MTTKIRNFPFLLLTPIFLAAALPTRAASQDEIFWVQLQRTDGTAPEQAQRLPQRDFTAAAQAPTPARQWVIDELQKSDGYAGARVETDEAAFRNRELAAAKKKDYR